MLMAVVLSRCYQHRLHVYRRTDLLFDNGNMYLAGVEDLHSHSGRREVDSDLV